MKIIIKNEEQIKGIKRSSQLASQTLDYLTPLIKEGVSTQEINDLAYQFIINHGARPAALGYMGFPKSICTSLNDVVCHGIPSSAVFFKKGDILNVDVTTILDGFYGDTSRMFLIEPVTDEARKLVVETKKAMLKAIDSLAPGKYLNHCVGRVIEDYVKQFGYASVRSLTGHGVGVEFHEDPSVFHFNLGFDDVLLEPGMILTVEPMINASDNYQVRTDPDDGWTVRTVDGALSAQWEHTVLITRKGAEILTLS
ncbi:MAG: type I methionyl aminopeptidase [Candidatus Shapirobacteria bacterium]|nr:type I methionyl aminopeptidase [Candidatus Shapirobacteria bacterium]